MTKHESLARFAAENVMGWTPKHNPNPEWDSLTDWWEDGQGKVVSHWNPAEVPADMMRLWEKAHQDGVGITLRNDYEGWQGTYGGFSIVDSDSGPAALTEAICRAFGRKEESDA